MGMSRHFAGSLRFSPPTGLGVLTCVLAKVATFQVSPSPKMLGFSVIVDLWPQYSGADLSAGQGGDLPGSTVT